MVAGLSENGDKLPPSFGAIAIQEMMNSGA